MLDTEYQGNIERGEVEINEARGKDNNAFFENRELTNRK